MESINGQEEKMPFRFLGSPRSLGHGESGGIHRLAPESDLSLASQAMKSVKLNVDTVDLLRAYGQRTGKTFDGVIAELLRRQQLEGEETLAAADRLRRIEEILLRLVEPAAEAKAKPSFNI